MDFLNAKNPWLQNFNKTYDGYLKQLMDHG